MTRHLARVWGSHAVLIEQRCCSAENDFWLTERFVFVHGELAQRGTSGAFPYVPRDAAEHGLTSSIFDEFWALAS